MLHQRKLKEVRYENCFSVFEIIKDYLMYSVKELSKLGPPVILPTVLGLFVMLFITVYTFFLIYKLFKINNDKDLIKTSHINSNVDYAILRTFDISNTLKGNFKYNFVLFLILPPIAFILLLIAYVRYRRVENIDKSKFSLDFLYIISLIYITGLLITSYVMFFKINKRIKKINNSIDNDYNQYVVSNIVTDASVLSGLSIVPTDMNVADERISTIINQLPATSDSDTITKTFVTLNIYKYYLSTGLTTNTQLSDVLSIFSPINILQKPDFLGNLVNGNTIIQDYSAIFRNNLNLSIDSGIVNQALVNVSNIMSKMNEKVNKTGTTQVIQILLSFLTAILIAQITIIGFFLLIMGQILYSEKKTLLKDEKEVSSVPVQEVVPSAPPPSPQPPEKPKI